MTPTTAFGQGVRRVTRAPWLLLGSYVVLLALALPAALVLRGLIAAHLGDSLAAERAATGVNFDWWNEFLAQAAGLGTTFTPSILGFGGTLRNLSDVADARPLPPMLLALVGVYLSVQTFLSGGVLDRLARDRRAGALAFFAACGGHFFRLVRLNVIAASIYLVLFGPLHRVLFDRFFPWLTRDFTTEWMGFATRASLYAIWLVPLVAVILWIDYARIRIVVEDRRSVLAALLASWRFLRRRPIRSVTLYVLNALIFLALLATYALCAPGAASGWAIWLSVGATQVYVMTRLALRLVFAASQTAFFQGELAHAGWVAASLPEWPDPPATEVLR